MEQKCQVEEQKLDCYVQVVPKKFPALDISGHPVIREYQKSCRMTTFSNLVIRWMTPKIQF